MTKRLARFLILFHLFGKFAGFLFSPSKQMVVNRAKNLKAGEEKSEIEVPKAWIPLAIADTIEEKYPKRIDVLGESFVVWRDPKAFNSTNKGWTVMRDYCPHRFAPLSEGRIDEKTGCLECPYHGWQFRSETGECTRIPQALSDEKKMTCTTQTTAKTFPVHLTSQIIWAYLPVSGLNQSFPDFPENLFPEINDAQRLTMVRDVPYSFDFTVENFMDPAHIPFAHHRLQGSRDDAIGIPMEILTNIDNQTHCEVSFQDRTRKRKREGIVSFISPIFYSLKLLNQESNDYHRPLYMFVVPVEIARTRIFVSTKIPMSLLFKLFPTWFLHAATMKFINSDIWVYDQEKMIRNPLNRFWKNKSGSKLYNDALLGNRNEGEEILPKYTLVTQSDRGCIAWRKWWKKHMSLSPIFGASTHVSDLTKTELLDHYEFHTKDCQHCQKALKRAKLLRKINPVLSLAAIGFFKNIYVKLLGILSYILVEKYIEAVEKGTLGPDRFEKTTAAQFD